MGMPAKGPIADIALFDHLISAGSTVRPSALAVLRLMANSKGRAVSSAAPFSIRSISTLTNVCSGYTDTVAGSSIPHHNRERNPHHNRERNPHHNKREHNPHHNSRGHNRSRNIPDHNSKALKR